MNVKHMLLNFTIEFSFSISAAFWSRKFFSDTTLLAMMRLYQVYLIDVIQVEIKNVLHIEINVLHTAQHFYWLYNTK